MIFLLKYLKNPTVLAILGLTVALGVQTLRVSTYKTKYLDARMHSALIERNYANARAEGEEAARKALQEAIAKRDALVQEYKERAAEALRGAEKASEDAKAEAEAWKKRYEKAKREEPKCRAWSEQPVACPLD